MIMMIMMTLLINLMIMTCVTCWTSWPEGPPHFLQAPSGINHRTKNKGHHLVFGGIFREVIRKKKRLHVKGKNSTSSKLL